MINLHNEVVSTFLRLPTENIAIHRYLKILRLVPTRQRMAIVAAFLSPIKELSIMPVPQLTTTDCGVHWIPSTKENGEIVVSTQLGSF